MTERKPPRMHWLVGRENTACGVARTVFLTRDTAKVTCPKCLRELRMEESPEDAGSRPDGYDR